MKDIRNWERSCLKCVQHKKYQSWNSSSIPRSSINNTSLKTLNTDNNNNNNNINNNNINIIILCGVVWK